MKNTFTALLVLIATSFLINSANAADYQEGKQYKVVPGQATKNPELREYFSYYCPHCRTFEMYIPEFKKQMPSNAKFKKTHVDFMGQASPDIQFLLSKALIVAEKTGIAAKFTPEVFNYIQVKRQPITGIDIVRKIFIAAGGDASKFDKGMKSFSLVSQAKRNKKMQEKLNRGRYLTSVPTFVVNGKYVINSKGLDQKNPIEDYKNLIAYLFTLK